MEATLWQTSLLPKPTPLMTFPSYQNLHWWVAFAWRNLHMYIYIYVWLVVWTILKHVSSSMGRMPSHIWNGNIIHSCSKPPSSLGIACRDRRVWPKVIHQSRYGDSTTPVPGKLPFFGVFYSGFSHEKWWFSIVNSYVNVYQRVTYTGWWCKFTILKNDGAKVNGVGRTSDIWNGKQSKCLKPPGS